MKIVVYPGDGVGPEIVSATLVLIGDLDAHFDLGLQIERHDIGLSTLSSMKTTFPPAAREVASQADGIVLGPLSTSEYPSPESGGINASAWLRQNLDLFANVRPVRSIRSQRRSIEDFDVVLVRENTEGFYAVRTMHAGSGEFAPDADTAFALRKITAANSARIADIAIGIAAGRGRRVTAVHKANVLKITDGLFLRECRARAAASGSTVYGELIVDAAAAALVSRPQDFDVVVTTNMFGDILSNLLAAMGGGLGIAGSLNFGATRVMAQAAHGSAPDIADQDRANPTSMFLSAAMLLEHLGSTKRAPDLALSGVLLRNAVFACLEAEGRNVTRDLGGTLGTAAFTEVVRHALSRSLTAAAALTREPPVRRGDALDASSTV
ncbi:isocitrate/isopropylmalate dehydrogenase family protein [Bradyrhizobium sp. SZCCHNRI20481]|uniref:isocitrate/isopropylmalate dehydrogenase family protein n=1 Tax=Bradyrhizobium sp. SZCCHNRI20481 TaxID=3057286 RepID=UPI002916513E|nr:isocitrate/isopropylmalate family dehydrogenase [Bradyrhizobium sp. SZCCHNRI20481]